MANVLTFREETASSEPAISFEDFIGGTNSAAVRIEPGDDARALIPQLEQLRLVEVNFPVFGDGRGYSAARILREAGYTGELRAVGDVLVDQIGFMKRCGFDAFQPDAPLNDSDVHSALARWPEVYQPTTDARVPIWDLRHG